MSKRGWPFDFASEVPGIQFSLCASSGMNVNMSFCRFAQNEYMFFEHLVLLELLCVRQVRSLF